MGLEVRVIRSIDDCSSIQAEWDQLLGSCPQATVFDSLTWIRANLLSFPNQEICIVAVHSSDSTLAAVVPMVVRRGRRYFRTGRWLEFAGQPYADYGSCLVRPGLEKEVAEKVIGFLVSEAAHWDGVYFDKLKSDAPFLEPFTTAAKTRGLRPSLRKTAHIRQLSDAEFAARGGRPGHTGKSLKKSRKRLEEHGEVRFQVFDRADLILERLTMFFDWHEARFRSKGLRSPLSYPQHREFYRHMVRELAPQGRIWLSVLACGDQPIAMKLTPLYGGTLHLYSTCFNEEFLRHSPSMLQLEALLEYAFRTGIRSVDFGIGESPQKEYASSTGGCDLAMMEIYRGVSSSIEGRIYHAVQSMRTRSRFVLAAGRLWRRFFPYGIK